MKRMGAISATIAAAALALAGGCFCVGDDVMGVAGYTCDPTNKVVMSRWVFPLYQWSRHTRDAPSARTYLFAGLGGWRRNRFDELAGTWVHPLWYRDRTTTANRSSNSVTRATSTRAGLLVDIENVRTSLADPGACDGADLPGEVIEEEIEVSVIPGFSWRSRNGEPPRIRAFWGLYSNDAEKRALEAERAEREARSRQRQRAGGAG